MTVGRGVQLGGHARVVAGDFPGHRAYLRSFGHSDARALHSGLAVAALGAALHPFGGVWAVFVVYACGLLGGVLPRRRAGAALAGVALALTALVVWRSLPMVEWLPALFFGVVFGDHGLEAGFFFLEGFGSFFCYFGTVACFGGDAGFGLAKGGVVVDGAADGRGGRGGGSRVYVIFLFC